MSHGSCFGFVLLTAAGLETRAERASETRPGNNAFHGAVREAILNSVR